MSNFVNHQVKKVVREQWCKPLLQHCCQLLECKFTYLGLPGIEAIDILTWIDFLKKVIAFEIGSYSEPYDDSEAKLKIRALLDLLNSLESRSLLENFSLYHGYLEEVVLKGRDRAGNKFSQNDIVTIYNLDFCNSLTAPVVVNDMETGETTKYYKSEVIRKLIQIQSDLSRKYHGGKFILYLTVHSQFWENESDKLFSGSDSEFYRDYVESLSSLDDQNRKIRLLRLYIIDIIKTHFCSNQFVPEFLPTLYYHGTTDNWMLCFTIIGSFIQTPACAVHMNQKVESLIKQKFLHPDESKIDFFISKDIKEVNCILDPVSAIKNLTSYKEIWCKK